MPCNTVRYHQNPVCYPRCYIHLRWRFLDSCKYNLPWKVSEYLTCNAKSPSNFSTSGMCVMWRTSPHICKFIQFCCKIGLVMFCRKLCFVAIHALLCGENLTKNSICGEKWQSLKFDRVWNYDRLNNLSGFKRCLAGLKQLVDLHRY